MVFLDSFAKRFVGFVEKVKGYKKWCVDEEKDDEFKVLWDIGRFVGFECLLDG